MTPGHKREDSMIEYFASSFEVIAMLGHLERGDEYFEMRVVMESYPFYPRFSCDRHPPVDCRRNANRVGGAPPYFAALQRA